MEPLHSEKFTIRTRTKWLQTYRYILSKLNYGIKAIDGWKISDVPYLKKRILEIEMSIIKTKLNSNE